MFQLKKAERKNVKLRIGFWGASGSGKTYSALKFARGFIGDWDKIAVIDTENGSAELYSHLGEFNHITLGPPFAPKRYIEAIKFLEKHPQIEMIIIDSMSHEWEGEGGCLEMHARLGGKFQDWSKVTPEHNRFVQTILQSRCHVLVTGRAKIDYDLGKDQNNKSKVEKVGLKTVTREGFDYEMTLAFKINQAHLAEVDKDRTGLFAESMPFLITEETGQIVRNWNDSGALQKEQEERSGPPAPTQKDLIVKHAMQLSKGNQQVYKWLINFVSEFCAGKKVEELDKEGLETLWYNLNDFTYDYITQELEQAKV